MGSTENIAHLEILFWLVSANFLKIVSVSGWFRLVSTDFRCFQLVLVSTQLNTIIYVLLSKRCSLDKLISLETITSKPVMT